MGSLLLVRHGQASAMSENYDRLSALGESQARLLGEKWARAGARFDRVFCGPRERQRRSAEIAVHAYRSAGGTAATPTLIDDLDEMRVEPLLQEHLPRLCDQHPALQALAAGLLATDDAPGRARTFGKLGNTVLRMWSQGQLSAPGVETWGEFRSRIRRALDLMLTGAPMGAQLAAFTSAGWIGAAAQLALRVDEERALDLVFRVRNASISEFLFSRRQALRFSLHSFNEVPHLADDPKLLTLL